MPPSSAEVVVSDAGRLISLGPLDLLALLPALFTRVLVPQDVLDECLARPDQADTHHISPAVDAGWLRVCTVASAAGPRELGIGERMAIGHALGIGAGLLVDDRATRRFALASGLAVIGALAVLALAKRSGRLQTIAPLIDRLRASGQRLSHEAMAAALAAAGEPAP